MREKFGEKQRGKIMDLGGVHPMVCDFGD